MIEKNVPKTSILIIYTGGTIGMIKDYKTKSLKAFDFNQILKNLPELEQLNCSIKTISFETPIDSSDMSIDSYYKLADIIHKNYDSYNGFVVLSGTDTMSYISSALSFMLGNLTKPIIFTGAQLPIGDLRTDAKENLITSIEIACAKENNEPIIQEVALYFEYKLFRANRTSKISADQFEAFSAMNYPVLAKSGVSLTFNKELLLRNNKSNTGLVFNKKMNANVVVLHLFPGITEEVIASIFNTSNIKGVVLHTYGSGNAPTKKWFIKIIEKAIKNGVHVVNVTQCLQGAVIMGMYESSSDLKRIGVINGKTITLESAIAKMMYLLGENLSTEQFKKYFERPLRGEFD